MRKKLITSKNTIHLNLKKEWFDMIHSGKKCAEYRALTPYFCERLLLINGKQKKKSFWEIFFLFCDNKMIKASIKELRMHSKKGRLIQFKDFDTITFSNGYAKDRKQFEILFYDTIISQGNTNWGAVEDETYFTLLLGSITQDNFSDSQMLKYVK